ncbi:MAG: hypothetical protein QG654_149 [Patescibacteria group bacterium]|jgi:hypothetical protein|nr:hypothetical protein [Patescibacteria group bacterium]
MNKYIALVLILGIGIFLFFNNNRIKEEGPQMETENGSERVMGPKEISLEVGKTEIFSNLSITFNTLVADYRCPADVQCIEAGAVVANITLEAGEEEITLNKPSDEVPLEFAGYRISIIDTKPQLLSGKDINPKDYVVTFLVEPMASGENI